MNVQYFAIVARLSSLAALPLLAVSASVLSGCVSFQSANFKSSSSATLTHVAGTPVSVTTENGRIVVEAAQRSDLQSVQISAEVRATTQERADTTEIIAERDPDGRLRVSVAWPDGQRISGEGCSITIQLPDVSGLDLRTSNGSVTIRGCAGQAAVVTSNGAIEVTDHTGVAKLKTSNGAVTVTNLSGALNADTSNGRIVGTGLGGPVDVDTSNGSISISLADSSVGPADLRTSNGTVKFRPGGTFTGTLSISTSNGSITLPSESGAMRVLEKNKTSAKVSYRMGPIAQPESVIRTSNGSVTVE